MEVFSCRFGKRKWVAGWQRLVIIPWTPLHDALKNWEGIIYSHYRKLYPNKLKQAIQKWNSLFRREKSSGTPEPWRKNKGMWNKSYRNFNSHSLLTKLKERTSHNLSAAARWKMCVDQRVRQKMITFPLVQHIHRKEATGGGSWQCITSTMQFSVHFY